MEIYDPAGPIVDGLRPQFHALVNGVDTPNVIPANRLDPLGMALINLLPAPNQQVDPSTGSSNYVANLATTVPGWQMDGKIDYYLNENNTLTGRYYMRRETQNVPDPFLSENVTKANTYGFTLSDNWNVTPSWLWNNRFTITRYNTPEYVKLTVNPTDINGSGIQSPESLVNNPFYQEPAFPSISFDSGYQGLNTDAVVRLPGRRTRSGRITQSQRKRRVSTRLNSAASGASTSTISSSPATLRADLPSTRTIRRRTSWEVAVRMT